MISLTKNKMKEKDTWKKALMCATENSLLSIHNIGNMSRVCKSEPWDASPTT